MPQDHDTAGAPAPASEPEPAPASASEPEPAPNAAVFDAVFSAAAASPGLRRVWQLPVAGLMHRVTVVAATPA